MGMDVFDTFLINMAMINPFLMKIVDAYTSIFHKKSVFRKKMVLLIAVLESYYPAYRCLDSAKVSSKYLLFIAMFQKGIFFLIALFLSGLIILPVHLIFRLYKNV